MSNEVELIKSRLDIVDVIGEYVRLKQAGANWKGLCPFHSEKTPSFMVHKEKQIWHCFGCGIGGDIFEFIQKIENVEFPEALEILARKAGVELSRQSRGMPANKRTRLFHLLAEAAVYYQEQLKTNSIARQYLAKRGVSEDIIKEFGLGYAPAEWDKLSNYLRNKGFILEELFNAGVSLKSDRGPGLYDRFRDRLMFPICDIQERVVGFGGRILDSVAREAKYINSPQGPIYNKSLILYNLNKAKDYIRSVGYALLVEGYMDVIGVWQAGIKNVVSTSGTSLTSEQVKLLKRYTNEIRLCFDADLAGETATGRGIDLALSAEMEVKIITLSQGKDPDEAVRFNLSSFKQDIERALPIGDYAFAAVMKKVDVKTREGKKQAAKLLLQAIAKLPDPVERDFYLKRLARELEVDEKSLRESLPVNKGIVITQLPAPLPSERPSREQMLAERFIVLLIKFGHQLWSLAKELEPAMLTSPLAELYRQALLQYTENQRFDFNELKNEFNNEPTFNRLIDVLCIRAEHEFSDFSLPEAEKELARVIHEIKLGYLKRQLKLLSEAITAAEQAGRTTELENLTLRYRELTQQIAQL